MPNHGERFLHNQDDSLHTSEPVEHEQARRAIASLHDTTNQVEPIDSEISHNLGDEVHTKPADKIADFLRVLEHNHTSHSDDPRVLDRIKASYHKTHVIKPEDVPESVFKLEQQIARNMGHGDIPITEEFRKAKTEQIISTQEHSLDKWVDYLTSSDATYPMWAKYWAFTAITKMGKLEKSVTTDESGNEHESIRFARRTEDTVAPFPPLNPRALALTIGVVDEHLSQKGLPKLERTPVVNQSTKLNDEDFRELIISESFSRIYSQFLLELPQYSIEGLKETRGEWKKYPQGSDQDELVDSLDGYPLEWCTADPETARGQLAGGDFYVYYSIDQDGNPVIPRVAIRMQGNQIAEVRGIAPDQNTDPFIAPVIEAKMEDFLDGKAYQKRSQDMARLTNITQRAETGAELTKEDLRFLYEIDGKIQNFGYQKDPRITELLQNRHTRADLAYALDCPPDQISLSDDEALSGTPDHPILFHHGNLNLNSLTSAEGLNLPRSIGGYLSLDSLTSAEGLNLPQSIGGSLNLGSLTSAEGLSLPQSIGGSLNLGRLTSAEGLSFPQSIGDYLNLYSLTSAEGLNLPQSIGGYLSLDSLTSAEKQRLRQHYPELAIN